MITTSICSWCLVLWSVLLCDLADLLLVCDFVLSEQGKGVCLCWIFDIRRVEKILNTEADLHVKKE